MMRDLTIQVITDSEIPEMHQQGYEIDHTHAKVSKRLMYVKIYALSKIHCISTFPLLGCWAGFTVAASITRFIRDPDVDTSEDRP